MELTKRFLEITHKRYHETLLKAVSKNKYIGSYDHLEQMLTSSASLNSCGGCFYFWFWFVSGIWTY